MNFEPDFRGILRTHSYALLEENYEAIIRARDRKEAMVRAAQQLHDSQYDLADIE